MGAALKTIAFFATLLTLLPGTAAAFPAETHEALNPISIIVIDPGHGGEDPGAIGKSGIKEKQITLGVAKALKKKLEATLSARVILTRTDDTYLPLEERTAIANREGADVFISIHANAAKRKKAAGVETFFLSLEASDNEAQMTAAIENEVIRLDEATHGAPTDDIQAILWDLTQTKAHHESARLAEVMNENLVRATGGGDRGVKQAPFIVLMGATMPAVLVEIGFISNPKEERKLSRTSGQSQIAAAISRGIKGFDTALRKSAGIAGFAGK